MPSPCNHVSNDDQSRHGFVDPRPSQILYHLWFPNSLCYQYQGVDVTRQFFGKIPVSTRVSQASRVLKARYGFLTCSSVDFLVWNQGNREETRWGYVWRDALRRGFYSRDAIHRLIAP